LSNDKNAKGIKDQLYERFKDFIVNELFPKRTATDLVSSNAKIVLYGLFALIGFAILTYAIIVTGDKYNPDTESYKRLNDTQRVERGESLDQLNSVYVAAISGAVALGGTLISQLWGRG
jgi:hypothetical protein